MKMTDDFLSRKIYVRFPNLHMDLQSLSSFYGYSLVQLAKRGIQRTPSMYDLDDIWHYLLKRYGLGSLINLKSPRFKQYMLSDASVLSYASLTANNQDLKKDLMLLSNTVKIKDNISSIEQILQNSTDSTIPRNISPSAFIKDGHINFRPKYDITRPVIIELTQDVKIQPVYYTNIYYKELSIDFGNLIDDKELDSWNFLQGLNRQQESPYLKSILEGNIRPTTDVGVRIQDAYFKMQRKRNKDFLFIETLEERRKYLDLLHTKLDTLNIEVKGLDDFCIYLQKNDVPDTVESDTNTFFAIPANASRKTKPVNTKRKRVKHRVIILTGYYVFDTDNKEYLPSINRILGFTGEFSREPQYKDQYPTYLINKDYDYEAFYRVEEDACLYLEDLQQPDKKDYASDIYSTLLETDKLSSNLSKIKRLESNKLEKQVELYWNDALEYDGMR